MELMEMILSKENLNSAYKKVKANKGASGVDKLSTEELGSYIRENRVFILDSLRNRSMFLSQCVVYTFQSLMVRNAL